MRINVMVTPEQNGNNDQEREKTSPPSWRRPWLIIRILIALAALGGMIFAALLFFKEPHMRSQPIIKTYQALMPSIPEGTVAVRAIHELSDIPDSVSNPLPKMQENMNRGKTYYGYYCLFCHGSNGDGNGPVGESYTPVPSDLRDHRFKSLPDGRLYKMMLSGIGHEPVLERVVPPEHRWYLVLYIRSLER
jgi:hypothetical protein